MEAVLPKVPATAATPHKPLHGRAIEVQTELSMLSIEQYSQISPDIVYEEDEEWPQVKKFARKSNSLMRGSTLRNHAKIKTTTPYAAQKRSV